MLAPTLVYSVFSSFQFAQLLAVNDTVALIMICHPLLDIHNYLTVPPNSSVDLNQLKSRFCQLNITQLMTQINTVFDMDKMKLAVSII